MKKLLNTLIASLKVQGQLTSKGVEYVEGVISNPPSREPGNGSRKNVIVDLISHKMGHTIAVESLTLEAAQGTVLELDDRCLAYFPQPQKICIERPNKNGRLTRVWTTFDFIAVYEDRVVIIECKREEKLEELSRKCPGLYTRTKNGRWKSPVYERALAEFGFKFKVTCEQDLPRTLIQNYNLLGPLKGEGFSTGNALTGILERIPDREGISLESLLSDADCQYTKNDVYVALLRNDILGPLDQYRLKSTKEFQIFKRVEDLEVFLFKKKGPKKDSVESAFLSAGKRLRWKGTAYLIANATRDCLTLQTKDGEIISLDGSKVENALARGEMHTLSKGKVLHDLRHKDLQDSIGRLSPRALEKGVRKARFLRAYKINPGVDPVDFGLPPVSSRTIQRWLAEMRKAETRFGSAQWGCYEKPRGVDRKPILPAIVHEKMRQTANRLYFVKSGPSIRSCFSRLVANLTSKRLPCPSYPTFRRVIHEMMNPYDAKRIREGTKGRNLPTEPIPPEPSWVRSSEYPLMVAQIDGKLMDLLLIDDETEEVLGRPTLTLITLPHYGSAPVGYALTFEKESYRSTLMAIRDMVERHGRGPGILIRDNGKGFNNTICDQLFAALEVTTVNRPPHCPQFSSEIEGAFRRLDVELVHTMKGNTRLLPKAREVSASHNPEKLATWTLKDFVPVLEEYLFDLWWKCPAKILNTSPEAAFRRDATRAPDSPNRLLVNSEAIELLFCPAVSRGGVRKVQIGRGVSHCGYYYRHPEMLHPTIGGTNVPVRYDPYDLSFVFAYIRGRWVRALTPNPPDLLNITEQNRRASMMAHRTLRALHAKRRETEYSPHLAKLGQKIESTERRRLRARRARAEQQIREEKCPETLSSKLPKPSVIVLPELDFSDEAIVENTSL